MKVCEQLTAKFKGREITSLNLLYEVVEFKSDGTILLYDVINNKHITKPIKDISTFEITN